VVAAGLLGEASQVMLEAVGVAERVAAGAVADATLRSVCVRMVVRVLLNPLRLRQFSDSVDDVSRSGTFEPGLVPVGELVLTANEVDRLLGQVAVPGAFSAVQPWLLVPPSVDPAFPPGVDEQWNKIYLLDPSG
jgi:hypothetical protein